MIILLIWKIFKSFFYCNTYMKSIDYTLKLLPGEIQSESVVLPLENPKPILQQTKSDIVSNPFIVSSDDILNPTFSEINKNVSTTFIDLLDDLFNKSESESWNNYLPRILLKDNRYNYIAVLLFFIALYILLVK